MGAGKLAPGEGMGPGKLAPGGERDGPSRPRPRRGVAVAETAGVRGVEGSSREGHGSATGPSPMPDLVTEIQRTSPFLPSSSDVAIT